LSGALKSLDINHLAIPASACRCSFYLTPG
jgi:hypothetical protein